ncbi:hypothetical protein COD86_26860 [Bacillus cereus]|nr:hypothetical protein COD14_19820 [Bacillus cereus]PGV90036.1 hypothetical protein COD86_26860 [Bacillus cereus]
MKKLILKTFFKKEVSLIHNNYQRQVLRIKDEFETRVNKLQKTYNIPKKIFSDYPHAEMIGIEKDKKNKEIFVFKVLTGRNLSIKLYGIKSNGSHQIPRILATVYKELHHEPKYIWIDDIIIPKEEIGNGSIAMKYLIKVAKQMEVSQISGILSPVDSDHFDKLEHFYKKFGFEVKFNTGRTEGSIKKILPICEET